MSERFDIDVGSWDPRDMHLGYPDPRDELPSRAEAEWEAEQDRRREMNDRLLGEHDWREWEYHLTMEARAEGRDL